uniref:SGNH hydrolase-type esterase domain-containing protein n=1 Tax=Haptolina ericina TaxID=156174 RepID=A0A7S3FFP7_9EUKA
MAKHHHLLNSAFGSPFPAKRVLLTGDSLMKQLFISIACVARHHHSVRSRTYSGSDSPPHITVDWEQAWPCHGTPNCVRSGQHSGFNRGSVFFAGGGEVHFVPLDGHAPTRTSRQSEEPNILARILGEAERIDRVTFGRKTIGSPRGDPDVIFVNAGIHNARASLALRNFADKLDQLNTSTNLPEVVWVTTPTQHFPTASGQYESRSSAIANNAWCVERVARNPRADMERTILQGRTGVLRHMLEYDDLGLGALHIGLRDCTHYCMPGVPDVMAARMVLHLRAATTRQRSFDRLRRRVVSGA